MFISADGGASGAASGLCVDSGHDPFVTPLQKFQFIDKYARWREDLGRRETWPECCNRVISWFRKHHHLRAVDEATWRELHQGMFELEASPAMRVVQMAGPALDRCNIGSYNCSAANVDCLEVFPEALYILMQGSGFGFSVEKELVDQLPVVKKQQGGPKELFVVPDTTEGWCNALKYGLELWFSGRDIEYDFSLIRPAGSKLKTKGGTASGPGPLRKMLRFVRQIVLSRQGEKLRPIDCHDMLCMIGKIVQVGGVRRASELSLSDPDDAEMRNAKTGAWWEHAPWRDMANISAAYEGTPSREEFDREWDALRRSGSGERGIFNRKAARMLAPARRLIVKFILNPCAEILLRSLGLCNLSITVARHRDNYTSLRRKVRLAAIFGTIQATFTKFRYVRDGWRINATEEALIGVDVTGQMDCPLLRPGAPGRTELVKDLKEEVLRVNETWARKLGINRAAAATCVKPSGNSAAFFNCRSGIHVGFAKHQLRRVRVAKVNPVGKLLVAQGVPYAEDPLNDSLWVFDFVPPPLPEGTPDRNAMTAVEQFHNWLFWRETWAEHSVSCTIYVGEEEWGPLGEEVYKHFDKVTGLSFLPRSNGSYKLAPNEEISQEEHERLTREFPVIDWSQLSLYEKEDNTTSAQELACTANGCDLF